MFTRTYKVRQRNFFQKKSVKKESSFFTWVMNWQVNDKAQLLFDKSCVVDNDDVHAFDNITEFITYNRQHFSLYNYVDGYIVAINVTVYFNNVILEYWGNRQT